MSDESPLVSIIIPTYNQKHSFLIECIESAINQTYQNIEIVISDNHSNNGASDIITNYAMNEKRIKVKKPVNHLPMIKNFLFAADNALGKYICIISSDDVLLRSCVEELVPLMENNPDVVMAHSEAIHFTPDGKETLEWKHFNMRTGIYSLEDGMDKFIEHRYTYMAGPLIRTDKFKEIENEHDRIKFSMNITYSYDTYLLFRMLAIGKVAYVGHPLAKIRIENDTRELKNIHCFQDYYYSYSWLENSTLMDRIPNAKNRIKKIKARLVCGAIPILIYKRSKKMINKEDFKLILKNGERLTTHLYPINFFIKMMQLFPYAPVLAYKAYALIKPNNKNTNS